MNVRTIIAAALIVFSLLFSNSVIAQANVSGKQPFSQSWVSCSGEEVDLEGWTQTVYNLVYDEAGGSHYLMTTNVNAKGVGSWGTKYRFIDSFPTVAVANAAGGYTTTGMQRAHLISQGPVNFHVWVDYHVTITPDGSVIQDWFIIEALCF